MNTEGTSGWAAGTHLDHGSSVMLRYDGTEWKRDEAVSAASGGLDVKALWMNTEGTSGWAAGDGVMLRYDGTHWKRDEVASAAGHSAYFRGAYFDALWMNTEGTSGWAAGGQGVMLHYDGTHWNRTKPRPRPAVARIFTHCG